MRGLRTIPVLADMVKDMEEVAKPGAMLLNYTNPMAAVLLRAGQGLERALYRPVPRRADHARPDLRLRRACRRSEIDFTCVGGINHMAWFLKLEHTGQGPLPALQGELREARVLRQREGAHRGDAPLRVLHDREHGAPLRVPPLVPQQRARPEDSTATSRRSAASPGPTTSGRRDGRGEVRGDGPAAVRVAEAARRAARSTAPTSSRRSRPGSRSGCRATCATTATSPTCRRAAAWRCRSTWTGGAAPAARRRPAARSARR